MKFAHLLNRRFCNVNLGFAALVTSVVPTCCDSQVSRAVHRAVRVRCSAAEETTVLWEGLGYHQGANLLCTEQSAQKCLCPGCFHFSVKTLIVFAFVFVDRKSVV